MSLLNRYRKRRTVGLPEPEFDYDANGLMVLFKGKPVEASEKVAEEWRENGGEMAGKVAVKTSVKILELVKSNPEITVPEIAARVSISVRTIERNIQKLQKDNLLKRVGGANGGHWEVVE